MYKPRNDTEKSTRIVKLALAFSWLLIIIGVYYVFFWNKSGINTDSSLQNSGDVISGDTLTTKYYIGEKIIEQGTIKPVESFTTYTHTLVTDDGQMFGVKSKDHDLYQFSGTVQIKGSIDDFKSEIPIVLITEIVGEGMNQANAASGDLLNAEFYLFEDVGLGFDLSISQGFEVTERGDTIVLTDTQDNKDVLTVSPFQCSSTDSLKDCVSLQDKFEEYNNEKFTSSNGITFYNLTETNTRAAFNENSYGYYLNPSSSRDLINFADLMVFVDEKGIKEALEAQMGSLCKNIDHQLTSIYELRVAYGDDGKTEVTVEGDTNNGKQASCKVIARLGTTYQFTLVSFVVSDDDAAAQEDDDGEDAVADTDEHTQADSEETNSPTDATLGVTPPSFETNNDGFSGWLAYPSIRGFTLYFSNPSISYAGEIRDTTDLGIDGLSCNYQVNIIQWQNAAAIDSNPDVLVYECAGDVSASALSAANLQKIGTTEEDTFVLVKYLSNNLSDLQIGLK